MMNKFANIYLDENNYLILAVEDENCIKSLDLLGDDGQTILDDLINVITEEFNKIVELSKGK